MAGIAPINQAAVVACVEEFYNTTDEARRHQLNDQLCQFKLSFPCAETIAACIQMMSPNNSPSVQFFGAVALYDTVRERSEDCISVPNLVEMLKAFLISNLGASAHGQLQSVTQKLSSTLALLALYAIPDVWTEPVQDLCATWSAVPELLLRVLAELAAEFTNIKMPMTQRSILKTNLHRMSEEIIIIIKTIMASGETTPSTSHAAVECVEQWVQLPGIGLQQWTDLLSDVFAAVSEDNAGLTNLLNILANNEELGSLDQLVLDICRYMTQFAAQKIASELQADSDSEEAVSLVAAVCALAEKAIPTLIRHTKTNKDSTILTDLCQMFATLCSWEGHFPVDEFVSDLPAIFFSTLREHLLQSTGTTAIIQSVKDKYGGIVQGAVRKLAYPPRAVWRQWDQEQKEKFKAYRDMRSELVLDAFYLVGNTTMDFLNQELESAINAGDACRTECVLYLWQLVADYLSEDQFPQIYKCMELVIRLYDVPAGSEGDRLGSTLMQLIQSLSHLIEAHNEGIRLQTFIIRLCLSFIDRPRCSRDVLFAIDKMVSDRNEQLYAEIGQEVSEKCYRYFMEEKNSNQTRLSALKCIGCVLSVKPTEEIMDIVNRMISPHVSSLSTSSIHSEEELKQRMFQIEIFSGLFATLHNKKKTVTSVADSPLAQILSQAVPVFRAVLGSQGEHRVIGDRVCDAVRSAVCHLPDAVLPEVFPFVIEIIDLSLLSNGTASCCLAKSTVLAYNRSSISADLCVAIARWFAMFEANPSHQELDEFLSTIYIIVKKDWRLLRKHGEISMPAITSAVKLAGSCLMNSGEPAVVRLASQILATIATQTTSFDDDQPRQLLAEHGPQLVQAIFKKIQNELIRTTVDFLAEVLFFFAKYFPGETRAVIKDDEYADSPMVAAMLHEVGNLSNFKRMTQRFNAACRKA